MWRLLLLLAFVLPAAADCVRYDNIAVAQVSTGIGTFLKPLPLATVQIFNAGTSTLSTTTFSDSACATPVSSITGDANGNFNFYGNAGRYKLVISSPGVTTVTMDNVVVAADPLTPKFTSVTAGTGTQGFVDVPSTGGGVAGTSANTVRYQGCSNVACVSENQATPATLWKGSGTVGKVPITTTNSTTLADSLIGAWDIAVNNSPRAKWYGFTTGTLQFAFTVNQDVFTKPLTITRFTAFFPVQPVGCATNGVVDIFDNTASSSLVSLTTANGTAFYDSGTVAIVVAAGHQILARHKTAATGCSTYGAGTQFNLEFVSQ